MSSSFTVGYFLNGVTRVVFGVTSIVPNLNGILLFVENGNHIQIESHQMIEGCLDDMFIDYVLDKDVYEDMGYTVIDCRN